MLDQHAIRWEACNKLLDTGKAYLFNMDVKNSEKIPSFFRCEDVRSYTVQKLVVDIIVNKQLTGERTSSAMESMLSNSSDDNYKTNIEDVLSFKLR